MSDISISEAAGYIAQALTVKERDPQGKIKMPVAKVEAFVKAMESSPAPIIEAAIKLFRHRIVEFNELPVDDRHVGVELEFSCDDDGTMFVVPRFEWKLSEENRNSVLRVLKANLFEGNEGAEVCSLTHNVSFCFRDYYTVMAHQGGGTPVDLVRLCDDIVKVLYPSGAPQGHVYSLKRDRDEYGHMRLRLTVTETIDAHKARIATINQSRKRAAEVVLTSSIFKKRVTKTSHGDPRRFGSSDGIDGDSPK